MIPATKNRYFVRWITAFTGSNALKIVGWEVVDGHKHKYKQMAVFGPNDEAQAEAICKLLNSNEELEHGV